MHWALLCKTSVHTVLWKQRNPILKSKKIGKKSQMMSIYGKAIKKVNIRMENAIERSSGKKTSRKFTYISYMNGDRS